MCNHVFLRFGLTWGIEVLVTQDWVHGRVRKLLPEQQGHLLQVSRMMDEEVGHRVQSRENDEQIVSHTLWNCLPSCWSCVVVSL